MSGKDIKKSMMEFSRHFDKKIELYFPGQPELLYQPIRYISSLPSKKLRPFLLYMFTLAYDKTGDKKLPNDFWNNCVSIEMMHNFSLIHDDIMDDDDWRRGKETVHRKWDTNTAILGGDGLLALSFNVLSKIENRNYREIFQEFSRAALTVCEGQALDKVFENRNGVFEDEYLEMIYKKTASLIEAASVIGAYTGNAPLEDIDLVRDFGRNLGLAFQLQDDYLDIFGSQSDLGKDIGSDILLHKKTLIMIRIMEDKAILEKVDKLAKMPDLPIEKIKSLLVESGIADDVAEKVKEFSSRAKNILEKLKINDEIRSQLWELADYLEQRSH